MLEDFRLKVFICVAKHRSFTAASRELGISQPAVSQNISELEKTLGAQLFERTRSEVKLTEKGSLFMEYASQIMHWYKAAAEAFSQDSEAVPPPVTLTLEDGRQVAVWSSQGDIHLKLK